MPFDLHRLVGAVTREISDCERDGVPARLLVASRVYDTERDDLWDALTNAERIPRWFLPVSGDLAVGGRYQFQGNAGGTVLQCERPRMFEVTWESRDHVSWVTVTLADAPAGGTLLRLEHVAPVDQAMWDQFGPGAVGVGWEHGLFGLDQHFATGETVTPENAAAWQATEDARAFVRETSRAWEEASIAAGTDPAQARAAGARTTAAYLGDA